LKQRANRPLLFAGSFYLVAREEFGSD